jgi:hypothetical protein
MQPDFSKMAQQAQAQAQGQEQGQEKATISFEKAKQTITQVLQQFGSQIPEGSVIPGQIDELARLLASGDEAAAEKHPLMKLIIGVLEGSVKQAQEKGVIDDEGNVIQKQGMMQEGMTKAPKNFAGMMKPPMGGGMSGR